MAIENHLDQRHEPRVGEVLDDVSIPLANLEYTIEQYLLAHGARLDTETRFLLAGVRDCVGQVAGSTRRLTDRRDHAA
ncbi:MAG: hypothetical protein AAF666_20160 [Pseudomonadota bacterium]